LTLYSTILSPSTCLPHTFPSGISKGYIHVIQTSGYNPKAASGGAVKVSGGDGNEEVLREGDGAYIFGENKQIKVENVGNNAAEVLLFDLE
jgi:quercetin 2,3-dioxygenase